MDGVSWEKPNNGIKQRSNEQKDTASNDGDNDRTKILMKPFDSDLMTSRHILLVFILHIQHPDHNGGTLGCECSDA